MDKRDRMKRQAIEELVSWAAGLAIVVILLLAPAPQETGAHHGPDRAAEGAP